MFNTFYKLAKIIIFLIFPGIGTKYDHAFTVILQCITGCSDLPFSVYGL